MGSNSALASFPFVEFADDGLSEFPWASVHNLHRRTPSSKCKQKCNDYFLIYCRMCGNIDFITKTSQRFNILMLSKDHMRASLFDYVC